MNTNLSSVSIVIKTYDDSEESNRGFDIKTPKLKDYLRETLDKLIIQECRPCEIIVVDASKGDGIAQLLEEYNGLSKGIVVHRISMSSKGFTHPKALNIGVQAGTGEIVVSLSGDATPVGSDWLKRLISPFQDPKVAGVWGGQIERPNVSTPFLERFRLGWRYKKENFVSKSFSVMSNANAAVRRQLALDFPYDEKLVELEDYKWAKIIREQGYLLVYAGDAGVYHSHVASNLTILQRMIYYFYLRVLIDLGLK